MMANQPPADTALLCSLARWLSCPWPGWLMGSRLIHCCYGNLANSYNPQIRS